MTVHLQEGAVLEGRYRIIRSVGTGSTATVYLAEHITLNMQWAIKALSRANQLHEQVDAFQEAHVLKALNHPGLPRVIDVFQDDDAFYIVRDYIPGETLEASIETRGPMDHQTMCAVLADLAETLTYLHEQAFPIVYRDLKPANIIIKPDGKAVLVDFGISRHYKFDHTSDTVCLGTQGYAPPEQFGGLQTDPRSDVYAFGALIYYLVSGEHLHLVSPNERWSKFKGGRLETLKEVITKAMSYDMSQRHETVKGVYQEIEPSYKPSMVHETPAANAVPRQKMPTQLIGFLGTARGTGATHLAIAMSQLLKREGHRVCFVERHGQQGLVLLEHQLEGLSFPSREAMTIQKFKGISIASNLNQMAYLQILNQGFDYVIVDFGASPEMLGEFLRASHKFAVLPSQPWAMGRTVLDLHQLKQYSDVKFVANMGNVEQAAALGNWLQIDRKRICGIGYIEDPWCVSEQHQHFIDLLMLQKGTKRKWFKG